MPYRDGAALQGFGLAGAMPYRRGALKGRCHTGALPCEGCALREGGGDLQGWRLTGAVGLTGAVRLPGAVGLKGAGPCEGSSLRVWFRADAVPHGSGAFRGQCLSKAVPQGCGAVLMRCLTGAVPYRGVGAFTGVVVSQGVRNYTTVSRTKQQDSSRDFRSRNSRRVLE